MQRSRVSPVTVMQSVQVECVPRTEVNVSVERDSRDVVVISVRQVMRE